MMSNLNLKSSQKRRRLLLIFLIIIQVVEYSLFISEIRRLFFALFE